MLQQNATVVQSPSDSLPAITKDTLNYRDEAGLKQGIWKHYLKGKIWKIEPYKDNLLHGQHYEYWANGEVMRTDYVNGIKHGYYLHYEPASTSGRVVSFYDQGEYVWSAFPWDLESFIVPVKGFHTSRDTVEIKVPYNTGELMYKGSIVGERNSSRMSHGVGIHQAYYATGELKARVDYTIDTIYIFNKRGQLVESEKIDDWRGRRVE
jgi:antitoxin component YwqK of YwqJK toxin-antitoxin module